MHDWMARQRFSTLMLGYFAGFVLILARDRVYGVLSYLVTRSTHDIGIRIALDLWRTKHIWSFKPGLRASRSPNRVLAARHCAATVQHGAQEFTNQPINLCQVRAVVDWRLGGERNETAVRQRSGEPAGALEGMNGVAVRRQNEHRTRHAPERVNIIETRRHRKPLQTRNRRLAGLGTGEYAFDVPPKTSAVSRSAIKASASLATALMGPSAHAGRLSTSARHRSGCSTASRSAAAAPMEIPPTIARSSSK